jgi:hypothetical protein
LRVIYCCQHEHQELSRWAQAHHLRVIQCYVVSMSSPFFDSSSPGILFRLRERCESFHQILHLQVLPRKSVVLCCTRYRIQKILQWNSWTSTLSPLKLARSSLHHHYTGKSQKLSGWNRRNAADVSSCEGACCWTFLRILSKTRCNLD